MDELFLCLESFETSDGFEMIVITDQLHTLKSFLFSQPLHIYLFSQNETMYNAQYILHKHVVLFIKFLRNEGDKKAL